MAYSATDCYNNNPFFFFIDFAGHSDLDDEFRGEILLKYTIANLHRNAQGENNINI